MTILDLSKETYFALSANKARSGLTILGIVIGIGSVIAMISIGQGAQYSIESSIQSIGSNLLIIMPGSQRGPGVQISSGRGSAQTLTLEDSEAIQKEIPLIKATAAEISKRYQVTAKGTNTNTQIVGTVPSYPAVRNLEMASGYFISEQQIRSLSKVAVLGPTVVSDLFGENTSPIGSAIRINKIDFKLIGIPKSKGGTGFGSQDDIIFIPISTAQKFLTGSAYVNNIYVQVQDSESMAFVQQQITDLLLARHKISDPLQTDFSIMNQADLMATAFSVTDTLTILLAAIGGISLIVGGIGIMNMMLTTVTERTREIGLRKAIGAKRKDISMQFLAEAVMLTFIGGAIGIFFGWLASLAVTQFAGITTKVSLYSVLLAVGVSATIGIVFGYYPARKASKMNPIDALRYE